MTEKKPLNIAIGKRIQLSREHAGLTQDQLAEKINRSTQFISAIERGVAGTSLETIISLSEAMNVSCDWLLCGKQAASPVPESIFIRLSTLSTKQLGVIDRVLGALLELTE